METEVAIVGAGPAGLSAAIAEELGKRMVLNSVMVGFFGAVAALLDPDSLRKAIADSVPAGFRELNLRAFDRGFEYGISAVPVLAENSDHDGGEDHALSTKAGDANLGQLHTSCSVST